MARMPLIKPSVEMQLDNAKDLAIKQFIEGRNLKHSIITGGGVGPNYVLLMFYKSVHLWDVLFAVDLSPSWGRQARLRNDLNSFSCLW